MQIIYTEAELTRILKQHVQAKFGVSQEDPTPVIISIQLTEGGARAVIGIDEQPINLASAHEGIQGSTLSNLDELKAVTQEPAPVKRTRRTKEQIALDDEAVKLGFKDHADRVEKEAEHEAGNGSQVSVTGEVVTEVAASQSETVVENELAGVEEQRQADEALLTEQSENANEQAEDALQVGNEEQQPEDSSQEGEQSVQEEVRGTDGAPATDGNATNATAEQKPRVSIFAKQREADAQAANAEQQQAQPQGDGQPRKSIFAKLNKPSNG